jgi:hypothetical protein
VFIENWYSDGQAILLAELTKETALVLGELIEFGSWQGKSSIAIANACYPSPLHVVDHWLGNLDEDKNNISVISARERDVFTEFQQNIAEQTRGNVIVHKQDWREFISEWNGTKIRFCHIDASHDYISVKDNILAVLPFMTEGGILCGDDWESAHLGRTDLNGGVQRAVMETLSEYQSEGNLWYYRIPPSTSQA